MISLIIEYLKRRKKTYSLIALSLIIYDATLVIPTKVIESLIDHISLHTLDRVSLYTHIAILFGSTILSYITAYLWHMNLFQEAVHFKFDIQQRAFKKLVFMRTPYYEKFRSGDMMTRFSTDVEALMDFIGYGLMIILYAGGMIAFIIPTMFFISWQMTLVGMIPIFLMMVATYYLTKKQELLVEEARESISNLSDEVLETVEGIKVMRAYSKKDYLGFQFSQKVNDLARKWNQIATFRGLYFPIFSVMIVAGELLIIILGLGRIEQHLVTLGQVIALQLYLVSLVEPFAMISDFILVYQTGKTSFGKIQELIETGDNLEENGSIHLQHFDEIKLSNYQFSYATSSKPSLKNISLHFKQGQTLGIVGRTGSGKTTLVKQFLRQYPLGDGEFLVNQKPFVDYQRASIERLVGYVPQEHILFSKSVQDNIAMGKSNASHQEIMKAIETAAFSNDLENMQEGLETQIGERGLSISGGQKQRISIARAFLSEPDLLILDDSLSAVDAKTEIQIIRHIQEERLGKTTIIVTHRLSAIQHADWIIVMDNGEIVEEGRPKDLLDNKAWYYEQYQRQRAQEV
ncbi:ABC transporter ATP-binding protein [Streptococcus parauberis]|uniref:ABC transporter, ATP-binding protein n=2 Tax=Streptococcus parauberis TaxID=1348 RepID=F1YYU8_9STRE|nr:ABC transporter ATP-binding protein [Streptococcus parauberis]EGE54685.1 ABC transporter, ATP-binding protein [Streptococcus parauberis NCFD 2020]PCH12235.1 putative multidrug resistance ABC transporter ATP-binding/permease protein YheI [Streptococcus parauberis]RFE02011.1 putative multidrug resistance ABC transporter ATP-binding/permease protein YheI [Streptococcus parauberis]